MGAEAQIGMIGEVKDPIFDLVRSDLHPLGWLVLAIETRSATFTLRDPQSGNTFDVSITEAEVTFDTDHFAISGNNITNGGRANGEIYLTPQDDVYGNIALSM